MFVITDVLQNKMVDLETAYDTKYLAVDMSISDLVQCYHKAAAAGFNVACGKVFTSALGITGHTLYYEQKDKESLKEFFEGLC